MGIKVCPRCKVNPKTSYNTYCKSCNNERQKLQYRKSPESIKKSSVCRKRVIQKFLIECKDVPCTDCGIKYPPFVMDFDHVRGTKSFNLSRAASKRISLDVLKEEINKCEVVCANCHRLRTHSRRIV